MELEGTFQNGSVVFETDPAVPNGTKAKVSIEQSGAQAGPTVWKRLQQFALECEKMDIDLPEDFAANHDHYIHGTPKRQ